MNTFIVTQLKSREILDSRGTPTLEVELTIDHNISAIASVPSGASTGIHEAIELRDKDNKRFNGKGLLKIIQYINTQIQNEIKNKPFHSQKELDCFLIDLDGSKNKSKLGANTILAISIAFARCISKAQKINLYELLGQLSDNNSYKIPSPMINILNGGQHADNNVDIQEFMIYINNYHNDKFINIMEKASRIFTNLKKILKNKKLSTNVGDEGGFSPQLNNTYDVLDLISESMGEEKDVSIALDVASSTFYKNNIYHIDNLKLNSEEIIKYYENLIQKYPIISIEDPIAEDDLLGWNKISDRLNKKIQIVGDDLFVTNTEKIQYGIDNNIANSVIIKPNQIGTVTETIDAILLAKKHNYKPIISHRSGETEDVFISHLAVGTGCDMIKTGSISRTDRTAKYNELLRIEEKINVQ